jgi:hypothetical protein
VAVAVTSPTVGIAPRSVLAERPRLFAALSEALDVRFEGRETGAWSGLVGAIVLESGARDREPDVPTLSIAPSETRTVGGPVSFSDSHHVDRRLRGRTLVEDVAPIRTIGDSAGGDLVLAHGDRGPLWLRGPEATLRHVACSLPRELGEDESLRDRLKTGHFVDAVPLIQFLREIGAGGRAVGPPLRAAFILDDPNLHWHRYGYVDYTALPRHAREHDYHVSIATVPLDAWFVSSRAAEIFRSEREVLSLSIHGNSHVRQELGRDMSANERDATLAKALERIGSFERRSGVRVSRVMVAPHETCSGSMMRALAASGFEALCFAWRVRRTPQHPLAGFRIADVVEGGLPLVPRHPLTNVNDELVFRAFLDQPLVFSGHHYDLPDGMGLLADAAAAVNGLGEVEWLPLDEIAQRNYRVRSVAGLTEVELFTRRARLTVPEGADRLKASLAALEDESAWERLMVRRRGEEREAALGDEIPVIEGETIELVLQRTDREVTSIVERRTTIWPLLRRAAVEARDRATPALGTMRRRIRLSTPAGGRPRGPRVQA